MINGRVAGKMSILDVPSAAGKGPVPGVLPLAILVALTVNVYSRWSPNYLPPVGLLRRGPARTPTAGRKPYGLASAARPGPAGPP